MLTWHVPGEAVVLPEAENDVFNSLSEYVWRKLDKTAKTMPERRVLELGLTGYQNLLNNGLIERPQLITIIDFSLPSDKERMWVIDLEHGNVLYHCLVAHGRNSGELFAEKFSNIPGSYTSSPGFYLTDQIYFGRHGLSLYLDGLEKGINDKARERAIVMHSADYVSHDFVKKHGRLGRSHGCPAIPVGLHKEIIRSIKGGSLLYIHAPEEQYVMHSALLSASNI